MTTIIILSIAFLMFGLSAIMLYVVYDRNKSYELRRYHDSVKEEALQSTRENIQAQAVNIQQQEKVVLGLLESNRKVVSDNQKWVFQIKENTLVIYEERVAISEILDKARFGNTDINKLNTMIDVNDKQIAWLESYFTKTFKCTPMEYKGSKGNIVGLPESGGNMDPYFTKHSLN